MFKEGEFTLKEGRLLEKKWQDKIIFKRYSWYKDLSLNFEILLGEIKRDSNFYSWVLPETKEIIKKCNKLFVSLFYYPSKHKKFYKLMNKKLDKKGLKKVRLKRVEENLKMHPDLDQFFYHNYTNQFFCSESKKNKTIIVQFPGFKIVKIKI
tara:strand:+ start:1600 stop:2055 length:456 start_codon:yes stop_codon:yes gene_type:complete